MQLSIGIFESYEKMQYEAVILTLEKVIITSLGILVLIKGYGLIVFCFTFFLGGLISIASSIFILIKYFNFNKSNFKPSFATIKYLIRHSMTFGISLFLATAYNNVGILILSLMKTEEVVGWFSASFKFIAITNVVPMILIAAIYPALSRGMFKADDEIAELFTKCFKYLTFVAFPMVVGTIILSDKIIFIIFGEEFGNSVLLLKILAWTAALVFYNIYFTGIFKAANLQKLMVKIQIIGLCINIPLNFVLIYYYSYIGAAIATVGTELFIFISFMVISHRKIVKLQEISFLFKTVVSTMLMAIFSYYFKEYNVYLIVVGSIILFFSSLYLMKGFLLQEILPVSKNE